MGMQNRKNHLVQILLATYNGEAYLREQLNSLATQSHTNWKLMVRDDGSTDATLSILNEFSEQYPGKVSILQDAGNKLGSTGNFERLMDAANEAYIMLCDQDDIWLEDKIERSLTKLLELEQQHGSSKPLLVFTDLSLVDADGKLIATSFWQAQKLDPSITQQVFKTVAQSTITGCTIIANRPAIKNALPINIPGGIQHDHWLGICTAAHGYIGYIPGPTILYRLHGKNEVGLKTPRLQYLFERSRTGLKLWNSWRFIKYSRNIEYSLLKSLFFKLFFSIRRAVKHYLRIGQ